MTRTYLFPRGVLYFCAGFMLSAVLIAAARGAWVETSAFAAFTSYTLWLSRPTPARDGERDEKGGGRAD